MEQLDSSDFEDTQELEIQRVDEAVREIYGISLEELGQPGSFEREDFINRYLAEDMNNQIGG